MSAASKNFVEDYILSLVSEDGVSSDAQQVVSLETRVSALSSRLAELELKIAKLENGDSADRKASTAESKAASQQVQHISRQLEIILEGLWDTPDYNIGRTFSCSSCGSTGVVAVRVKCTKCNHENWWGRWPQKQVAPRHLSHKHPLLQ